MKRKFGFQDRGGYAYFYGRGPETGRLWTEFCALVEEQSKDLDADAVSVGARQMFAAFREWVMRTAPGVQGV